MAAKIKTAIGGNPTKPDLDRQLVTARFLADRYQFAQPKTIYKRYWSGELTAYKIGRNVRFDLAEADRVFLGGE